MKAKLIALILFPASLMAQEINTLNLTDCYKMARENHSLYPNKQRIADNSILKIKNTNIQWYPQLSSNAQVTYQSDAISLDMKTPEIINGQIVGFTNKSIKTSQDQYKLTLDINQMLYDGGSIKAQKKIIESTLETDLLQNESELHNINEQVNQIYFGLLLLTENKKLLNNVRLNLLQRAQTIETALKNGIMQQSDLDNIKVELLKNKQQINELSISYSSFVSNLEELTGKSIHDSVQIILPEPQITDSIVFQRADLKAFDTQQSSLDFTDKLTKTQRMPRIYAFAQGGYGKPGLNMLATDFEMFYIMGITLKWNIWDWNKTSNDRKSISIQKEMLDSRKQNIQKNLRIAITNCKTKIMQLNKAISTDNEIVELRSTISKRSSTKLDQGIISSTEYINDLNAETQSRIQQQSHKIQLVQEKVNYLTILGQY
jgi:outer membrane protein TolC